MITNPFQNSLILTAFLYFSFFFFRVCKTTTIANYYTFDLSTGTSLIPTTTGFTIKGQAASNYLGMSVRTAGDIDNDGYDDIIVGANGYGSSKGIAYVIYGGATSSFVNWDFSSGVTLNPSTTGFTVIGNAASDNFGYSVSTAGDINKDGYDDIIVGAYGKSSGTGVVYVIYGGGRSSMQNINLASDTLTPSSTGFTITGAGTGNYLGYAVNKAGDVNNDGYDDIIFGAHSKDTQRGAAYVIYGGEKSSMSNILLSSVLDPLKGFVITGASTNSFFGFSSSTVGDINKDGYDDFLIGAITKNSAQGAAYVIYGGEKSSLSNIVLSSLNPSTTGFIITGKSVGDKMGYSVAGGDINNDGYDDIIVGASDKDNGSINKAGAVYVIYGGEKSSMSHWDFSSGVTLDPSTTGFMISGNAAIDYLGNSVSLAGDINKDGYNDILIGAFGKNSGQGAAYVIYGGQKSSMTNLNLAATTLNPLTNGFKITGRATSTNFAISVSIAGDINKDGSKDIIIGANTDGSPGAAYVIHTVCSPCWNCQSNCDTCPSSPTVCTQCDNTYLLYQSGCLSVCPAKTYPASGKCENCATNCNHCSDSSSTSCSECISPYLLHQSQCLATCPDTTFPSSGKCEKCSTNCNHCSDSASTSCTECLSSYLFYQSQCLSVCPDTTYASADICKGLPLFSTQSNYFPQGCPTNCNKCIDSITCTECTSPYLLYKSECISTCPLSTVESPGKCEDCPSHCFYCTSPGSCEVCSQGYTLVNSLCVSITSLSSPSSPPSTSSSSSSYQKVQERASRTISSATQVVGGIVCVGSVTFPVTALVSTIVQNTRYLNLSVTSDLSEIYKTWSTDLISWDVPNVISDFDHFKTAPVLFSRYDLGSSFLNNFWPTLVNMGIGLTTFITCSLLTKLLEQSEYNKGWVYSWLQKLVMGSFNFTLVQAYACLDNILFYLVLDVKTNPFNSFFSWASVISAGVFLALGCLLVFFNFWTVKKYQDIKNQAHDLETFNEKNKYWELFYSDFSDEDLLSQSFFPFLIMRSALSSLIVTVLYDYPLMQTSYLMILDAGIILFLIFKKPFNSLEATLCQYYFEIITLLVHICTFLLAYQDSLRVSSDTLRTILSTGIIYLNTALVSGSIGFMFVEICKAIRLKIKADKLKKQQKISIQPEENHETQNLTTSPLQDVETAPKRQNWLNTEQETLPENFHFFSGIHPNPQRINMEPSNELPSESHLISENSVFSDVNASQMMNEPRAINPQPVTLRRRRQIMQHQRRNESVMANNNFNHREQFEDI